MILVTVGMQLGFDRLIEAMDGIAPMLEHEVIAQTGKGEYVAQHMEQHTSIAPHDFEALVSKAILIVSHAGIGTVLAAARHGVPIVLFPRRVELGEHRNDHQLATCEQLQKRPGIYAAFGEADLEPAIASGLSSGAMQNRRPDAGTKLQNAVRRFIECGPL